MSVFNKVRQAIRSTKDSVVPITAELIQREMVDRTDKLMAEARAIVDGTYQQSNRALRLSKLGFLSTPEVSAHLDKEREISRRKVQIGYKEKYAMKYPGLKFIDDNTMEIVCKDYGLVVGEVNAYTGTVPDWVIERIENCGVPVVMYEVTRVNYFAWGFDRPEVVDTDGFFSTKQEAVDELEAIRLEKKGGYPYHILSHELMRIAAPIKEMIVRSDQRIEGNRIVTAHEDPIVSIRVPGGYCVIAAWGEEGSDPKVFNSDNN